MCEQAFIVVRDEERENEQLNELAGLPSTYPGGMAGVEEAFVKQSAALLSSHIGTSPFTSLSRANLVYEDTE